MDSLNQKGESHEEENHARNLAICLNDYRKQKFMCDVILVVPPKEYLAHRNVLCASSPYFLECLGTDSSHVTLGSRIEVNGIDTKVMEDVLNFMYIGEVCVGEENVRKLIAASDILKMSNLKDLTCRYYEKRLNPSNCLSIAALADEFNCDSLRAAADEFILANFLSVSEYSDFKLLSCSHVQRLLSSDEINVAREEQVYAVAMKWIDYDLPNRKQHLPQILSCVRLLQTSKYFVADVLEKDEELMSDPKCVEVVNEAKFILNFPDRKHMLKNSNAIRPRNFSDTIHVLLACGGNQERMSSSEVLCYVPSKDFWYPLAPLINSRFLSSSTVFNNEFVIFGGKIEGRATNRVEKFSVTMDKWIEHTPLPNSLSNHAACVFNGELYLIGGENNELSTSQVMKFSLQNNKWVTVKDLKVPRKSAAVATHKELYVIGGYDHQGMALASVERYNPYLNEWSKIFPMNSARAHASAICVGDNIYVFGGEYAMWSYYRSCEVFDILSDEWKSLTDMSIPRALMGVSLLENNIYLIGGMVSAVGLDQSGFGDEDEDFVDVTETNIVEKFNVVTNSWEAMCSLPVSTAGVNCGIISVSESDLQTKFGL